MRTGLRPNADSARVAGLRPHLQIGSYERGSGLADITIDDGNGFRVKAEFPPPE
jgi:hypothetical protein